MISAGYIGGGETQQVAPTVATPEAAANLPDAFLTKLFESGTPQEQGAMRTSVNDILSNTAASLAPKPAWQDPATLNAFTNLGNQILTGLLNFRYMDMQQTIDDRRWAAAETIEGYKKEVALKTLDYLPGRDRVAADVTRDVTRIREAASTDRYEARLRSQERIASMRNLDRAFGMRSDYNYGNPFAA